MTENGFDIYEAIIKRYYLAVYQLRPHEVEILPDKMLMIWNTIHAKEQERDREKQALQEVSSSSKHR